MSKRHWYWRDLLVSNDRNLWQEAIPAARDESELFDALMRKIEEEEDDEALGELMPRVARRFRIQIEPAEANEAAEPPVKRSKTGNRPGRPAKEDDYREMLREIRGSNPGSDGEAEFRDRLARRQGMGKDTSRRWYVRAAAALAQEKIRRKRRKLISVV